MCLACMSLSSSHRLTELFDRYLRRDLAPAEVEEFVSLLGQADAEELLTEPMRRVWEELRPGVVSTLWIGTGCSGGSARWRMGWSWRRVWVAAGGRCGAGGRLRRCFLGWRG